MWDTTADEVFGRHSYPREGDDPHERAFRAFLQLRGRMWSMRQKIRKEALETPPSVDEIQDELDLVSTALDNRRNNWVLKECERLAPSFDAAEKELGIS